MEKTLKKQKELKMTLDKALAANLPLRRPIPKFWGTNGDGWVDRFVIIDLILSQGTKMGLTITKEDILANDWEISNKEYTGGNNE